MLIPERLPQYIFLMRLDKPIGILLLLWPTLWALWLGGAGHPNSKIIFVFIMGVILMRSAGCVINDFADQHVDAHVKRTRSRPLASGKVSSKEALLLASFLIFLAFLLVLLCNSYTIKLAFIGVFLAVIYPFMKRITHLPQVVLGMAFTWGVPMAFAAQQNAIPLSGWFLYLTGLIWPVIYDTMYAMVDRNDDLKIRIKSSAILFNAMDRLVIGLLQILFISMLIIVGLMFRLQYPYYFSLLIVIMLFVYQQWLIKDRNEQKCFQAFINNNWVGFAIFTGIFLSYIK